MRYFCVYLANGQRVNIVAKNKQDVRDRLNALDIQYIIDCGE